MDDEARRVEFLLDLYKQQMDHYHHTLQVEWKCNFGIGTLLAGAIYIVTKEHINLPPRWVMSMVLTVTAGVHAWWLFKIHSSEVADKKYWSRYRAEALRIIRGSDEHKRDETPWDRSTWERTAWFAPEIMVTCLLCGFLFYSLPLSK